ncbi:hypothetical protein [Erysipelothrix inopinata]|uniref:hypothetical protein n=1 Tax=Erysipelothrix inopinata TaxID=225084 RepID=UPI001FE54A1D|nr:hypothetical protein [Erysipelothrix inopinata]
MNVNRKSIPHHFGLIKMATLIMPKVFLQMVIVVRFNSDLDGLIVKKGSLIIEVMLSLLVLGVIVFTLGGLYH